MRFFKPASYQPVAQTAFENIERELRALLPEDATIEHIGASSIPGAISKGDLDIFVGVEQRDFLNAQEALAGKFERNTGSTKTDTFCSFKDDYAIPPLGIQLAVNGSELDIFLIFRDLLRKSPELVNGYNKMKRSAEALSEDNYREVKAAFIEKLLQKHS